MAEAKEPAVLIVQVEVGEDEVDELNHWYEEEHIPEKLSLPGYKRVRRFQAADGSPKFLAIYDLDEPAAAAGGAGSQEARKRMQEVMASWKHWERAIWVELSSTP